MSEILKQAEALPQQAISLLLAERQTIDETLTQLGYGDVAPAAHTKPKSCTVCGSPDHNARFHKSRAQGSEEAGVAAQGVAAQPQT